MMTRREWLTRVLGATVAAAVAPLVDLTDMTPAFWQQPALRAAHPWRIVFPDGLHYTFEADVLSERALTDGTVQFSLRPTGPAMMHREVSYPMNWTGDPPRAWEPGTPLPSPDAPATVISRDGVKLGELVDITPPEMQRMPMFDALSGLSGPAPPPTAQVVPLPSGGVRIQRAARDPADREDTTRILGRLRRGPVDFTVEFK